MPQELANHEVRILHKPDEHSDLVKDLAAFTLEEMFGTNPNSNEVAREAKQISQQINAVILDGSGDLLATAGIRTLDSDSAMLNGVAVKAGMRREGLGRKVVSAAENLARDMNLVSMVAIPMLNSSGFYRKLGYRSGGSELGPHFKEL